VRPFRLWIVPDSKQLSITSARVKCVYGYRIPQLSVFRLFKLYPSVKIKFAGTSKASHYVNVKTESTASDNCHPSLDFHSLPLRQLDTEYLITS